jgi:CheY-like chemotaxis protein
MHMPKMDGLMVAQAIKADPNLASIRLVLMTSAAGRGDAEKARHVGVSAYLVKPVRLSLLYECLVTVIGSPMIEPTGRHSAGSPPDKPLVTRHTLKETAALTRCRVLIVEDDEINQKIAVRMLEKLGCRADVAANGQEAVEAVSGTNYSLIFMDSQMPEMDGFQATALIRASEQSAALGRKKENGPHTPIIAMTANAMPGDKERCLSAGMDDYVSKPVTQHVLRAVLYRWLPGEMNMLEAAQPSSQTMGDTPATPKKM